MAIQGLFAERLYTALTAYQQNHPQVQVTNAWLVERLAEKDVKATTAYLGHLRTGERDNPTLSLATALAEVLEVPLPALMGGPEVTADELAHSVSVALPQARAVLTRLLGVSDTSLDLVLDILDRIRTLEKLPPITTPR